MTSRSFGRVETLLYKVETNFPDTSRAEETETNFSSYSAHAYTDVRNPGDKREHWLIETQKELFDKRTTTQYGGKSECLWFENLEDAITVAKFLHSFGRITAGWSRESQEKYAIMRRGPLNVRIVREYTTNERTNIDFPIEGRYIDPEAAYEIELAALKKKHGKE